MDTGLPCVENDRKVYQDTAAYLNALMTIDSREPLRVDRWLWYTRFFKTRALASAAVKGGHVRINGNKARAGSRVNVGDRIQIVRQQLLHEVEVISIPLRRGPAPEARASYSEPAESRQRRQDTISSIRVDRMQMPRTDGKPDKRTRRKLRSRNRGQV